MTGEFNIEKLEDFVRPPSIKRGDYVRLKHSLTEPIGVVWDIHPKNTASVEVYYPVNGKTRLPREYEAVELVVIPAHEVTEYLVKFKSTMER
jgi:hypothetical protein